jgi:lipid A 3-O-deacylase
VGLPANHSSREFREAEIFANWNLPWGWDLGKELRLQSRMDVSVGWLGDQGDNAALGTVGPTLVLSRKHLPVSLEGGISPTLLTRSEFPSKNLGMGFQFTCHLGLNWDFATHWRLSYRFQHMSNADLAPDNPGLNLHVIGLSYVF